LNDEWVTASIKVVAGKSMNKLAFGDDAFLEAVRI
jgi:hypothetical protein